MATKKRKVVDRSGCDLEEIEVLENILDATTVILDGNDISNFSPLAKIACLEKLSVARNNLLRMGAVEALTNLRVLDLRENAITSIEGLPNLLHLEWLCLSENRIQTISNLSRNTLLRHLDLSFNRITEFGDLSFLVHLKTLLLEGNKLRSLKDVPKFLPPSLLTLKLAENELTDLTEIQLLSNLPFLEELTISGNPFTGNEPGKYVDYRPYVICCCKNMIKLDGSSISQSDRHTANVFEAEGHLKMLQPGQHTQLAKQLLEASPGYSPRFSRKHRSAQDEDSMRISTGVNTSLLESESVHLPLIYDSPPKGKQSADHDSRPKTAPTLATFESLSWQTLISTDPHVAYSASLHEKALQPLPSQWSPEQSSEFENNLSSRMSNSNHTAEHGANHGRSMRKQYRAKLRIEEIDSSSALETDVESVIEANADGNLQKIELSNRLQESEPSLQASVSLTADEAARLLHLAAAMIQAYVRGFLQRKRYQRFLLRHKAAVTIQALWKGYRTRTLNLKTVNIRKELHIRKLKSRHYFLEDKVKRIEAERKKDKALMCDALRILMHEMNLQKGKLDAMEKARKSEEMFKNELHDVCVGLQDEICHLRLAMERQIQAKRNGSSDISEIKDSSMGNGSALKDGVTQNDDVRKNTSFESMRISTADEVKASSKVSDIIPFNSGETSKLSAAAGGKNYTFYHDLQSQKEIIDRHPVKDAHVPTNLKQLETENNRRAPMLHFGEEKKKIEGVDVEQVRNTVSTSGLKGKEDTQLETHSQSIEITSGQLAWTRKLHRQQISDTAQIPTKINAKVIEETSKCQGVEASLRCEIDEGIQDNAATAKFNLRLNETFDIIENKHQLSNKHELSSKETYQDDVRALEISEGDLSCHANSVSVVEASEVSASTTIPRNLTSPDDETGEMITKGDSCFPESENDTTMYTENVKVDDCQVDSYIGKMEPVISSDITQESNETIKDSTSMGASSEDIRCLEKADCSSDLDSHGNGGVTLVDTDAGLDMKKMSVGRAEGANDKTPNKLDLKAGYSHGLFSTCATIPPKNVIGTEAEISNLEGKGTSKSRRRTLFPSVLPLDHDARKNLHSLKMNHSSDSNRLFSPLIIPEIPKDVGSSNNETTEVSNVEGMCDKESDKLAAARKLNYYQERSGKRSIDSIYKEVTEFHGPLLIEEEMLDEGKGSQEKGIRKGDIPGNVTTNDSCLQEQRKTEDDDSASNKESPTTTDAQGTQVKQDSLKTEEIKTSEIKVKTHSLVPHLDPGLDYERKVAMAGESHANETVIEVNDTFLRNMRTSTPVKAAASVSTRQGDKAESPTKETRIDRKASIGLTDIPECLQTMPKIVPLNTVDNKSHGLPYFEDQSFDAGDDSFIE